MLLKNRPTIQQTNRSACRSWLELALDWFCRNCRWNGSLLPVGKEHPYHRLIGVFWLRAGDDRLDVVPVRRVHAELRGLLRRGARFDPLDDHGRAVLAGASARRHVDSGARQLDGQLLGRHRLPKHEGES